MSHAHHAHIDPSSAANRRALRISAWLTGIYFVIELGIGIYTQSVAVLSDAAHTFSAVGGVLLALAAARLARRPSDTDRTFGWYRAEIIGALLNGLFLLAMAVFVIAMGAMRLSAPIDLPTGPMLAAAFGGLATEFVSLYLLHKGQKTDLNTRGAYWHVVQTFVGSLLIIVTALVIEFMGFLPIDPILGMAFGVVLLWASIGIMRDACRVLLEAVPDGIDINEVIEALRQLDGVEDVHHIHAWSLTTGRHVFSTHLRARPDVDRDALLKAAHDLLRQRFGFHFSTIQIETRCLDETHAADIDILRKG